MESCAIPRRGQPIRLIRGGRWVFRLGPAENEPVHAREERAGGIRTGELGPWVSRFSRVAVTSLTALSSSDSVTIFSPQRTAVLAAPCGFDDHSRRCAGQPLDDPAQLIRSAT